jgi:hypothetical protein
MTTIHFFSQYIHNFLCEISSSRTSVSSILHLLLCKCCITPL